MVSGSILKPNFTKVSFVKFWYSIKEEYPQLSAKAFKILLLFSIICVKLNFLHILQPKQRISTD